MQRRYLPALALFTAIQVACVPDPVMPTRSEGSHIPAITAERVQACMSEYGEQLDGYSYGVQATVQVDQDGRMVNVELEGMPAAAPDLATCTRIALRDMAVPEWVLQQLRKRPAEPLVSEKQTPAGRRMVGNVLVVGGAIAIGELVAKAFGATLILAMAVELVHTGVQAISKRRKIDETCNAERDQCLESPTADLPGSVYNSSRCEWCRQECVKKEGNWPFTAQATWGTVRCDYWRKFGAEEGGK